MTNPQNTEMNNCKISSKLGLVITLVIMGIIVFIMIGLFIWIFYKIRKDPNKVFCMSYGWFSILTIMILLLFVGIMVLGVLTYNIKIEYDKPVSLEMLDLSNINNGKPTPNQTKSQIDNPKEPEDKKVSSDKKVSNITETYV